ncbi:helix-turn-helix transcriptional regulator [Campylobacter sp. LR264d]|uniref:helix-turn-helix domain-containing protein n=1 Tax=Campylobacter sp. LR264d TaxID=2593544 RepID=UPI001239C18E|nr:helix-turn-helix transcriptional regulator [Campylobacter sp. LR264d]KAA6229959.1 helix-turn-helix transcriptional regulator [Campylobacter sp. LR264d]
MRDNLLKKTCKELNITQSELAKLLGYHFTSFSKWSNKIPKNSEITLNLLIENHRLKKQIAEFKNALRVLRDLENS